MVSFQWLCKLRFKLVDGSGRVVIRLSQDMTKPVNTVLSNGEEDVQLDCYPVELLIGHKIGPAHLLDDPEGAEVEAMDMRGKGLI